MSLRAGLMVGAVLGLVTFAHAETEALRCRRLLIHQILEATSSTAFIYDHFVEAERPLIYAYLETKNVGELTAILKYESALILADADELIAPEFRADFLQDISNFTKGGGKIQIGMTLSNRVTETTILTDFKTGVRTITVPSHKLLRAAAGVPGVKQSLMSDFVHELRHAITDDNKKNELLALGKKVPFSIYGYYVGDNFFSIMSTDEAIVHKYRLEEEAVAAERKFVPDAINSVPRVRYYPVLQALQQLMNNFSFREAESRDFLANNELFTLFTRRYVRRYLKALHYSNHSGRLDVEFGKKLANYQVSRNRSTAALDIAYDDLDSNLVGIDGRLKKGRAEMLRSLLRNLLKEKSDLLVDRYDQMLADHAEEIPAVAKKPSS